MRLIQSGYRLLAALSVVLMVAIAPLFVPLSTQPALATSIHAVSPTLMAFGESGLERRANAAKDQIEGKAQRSYGEAVDSPANQVEGSAKEFSGAVRNRVEDAGDQAKDLARETEKQGETLVDKIKDFFD
jgi:uncharacterized protein YjbJ (UPF0337 family)